MLTWSERQETVGLPSWDALDRAIASEASIILERSSTLRRPPQGLDVDAADMKKGSES